MEVDVREMDVCIHLPTRRRCLAVWVGADTARCVTGDDLYFDCRPDDLLPYRHPKFSAAVRLAQKPRRQD